MLNPGELFRRYYYHRKLKTPKKIEELIVKKILDAPTDSIMIVHWHYAVRRPLGYIPQIKFSSLKRLAESRKIERTILLSVEAPASFISKRRMSDSHKKKRALSILTIREEARQDKIFLAKHHALFSRILGKNKVTISRLINKDLRTAQSNLYRFFRKLLG